MMKVQGTMRFTYDINIHVCTHNIISAASSIMMKVQDTMKSPICNVLFAGHRQIVQTQISRHRKSGV